MRDKLPQRWHFQMLFRGRLNETRQSLGNRAASSQDVDAAGTARTNSFVGGDGLEDEMQSTLHLGAPQSPQVMDGDGAEESVVRPGAFAVNPGLPVRRWYSSIVFSQSDNHSATPSHENPSYIPNISNDIPSTSNDGKMPRRRMWLIGIVVFCMFVVGMGAAFGVGLAIVQLPQGKTSSSMITGDASSRSCHVLEFYRSCREKPGLGRAKADLEVCPEMDEFLRLRSQGSLEFNTSLFFGNNTTAIDWCSPRELSLWYVAGIPETVDSVSRLQQYALGVLFFSASGYDWASSKNWFQTYDHCVWYGVGCDPVRPAIVERLVLEKNRLDGTLPAELGLLGGLGKSVSCCVFDEKPSSDQLRHSYFQHWFQSWFGRNLADGTWASSPR